MKKVRLNGKVLSKFSIAHIIDNITGCSKFRFYHRDFTYEHLRSLLYFHVRYHSKSHILYDISRFENLQ